MTKEELKAELLERYDRKLFLNEHEELRSNILEAADKLPESVLEDYVRNAENLQARENTERGRKEGFNKLTVLYKKMQKPVSGFYDPNLGRDVYMQDGVVLESSNLELTMLRMQNNKLNHLGGDRDFTKHLYAMEVRRRERTEGKTFETPTPEALRKEPAALAEKKAEVVKSFGETVPTLDTGSRTR